MKGMRQAVIVALMAWLLSPGSARAQSQYGASYQIVSQLPARACSGQNATLDVFVTNTGTATWVTGGNWLLGHHWDNGSNPLPPQLYDDGTATPVPQTIGPGRRALFHTSFKFPAVGTYTLEFDMIERA